MRLGLREDIQRTFSYPHYHSTLNDHFVFVVLICYWFCTALLISQMLNERGYERETNYSGMLRSSAKLQRAQRVHRRCRIRIHANELAIAWAHPPRLI